MIYFTREKNDTSNRNRERCFFTCEKNDMSNQKLQRSVSFAPKLPPFIAACSAPSHTFNEKSFTQRVFLAKKVKNISEMEWKSFVCFTVDEKNGREPAKQQRKGKNRTRRKLLLCFLPELLCLSFKLKLIILKPAIFLKFTHFQLCIENKQLRLLIVLGLHEASNASSACLNRQTKTDKTNLTWLCFFRYFLI